MKREPQSEMSRRQRLLNAMMQITRISGDQLATRARHAAQWRNLPELSTATEEKISGLLSGAVHVSSREWALLVDIVAPSCKQQLRAALNDRAPDLVPVSGVMNPAERHYLARLAGVISAAIDISQLSHGDLALRVLRTSGDFASVEDVEKTLSKLTETIMLSSSQWRALTHVVIGAAVQAVEREQQFAGEVVRDPEPGPRAQRDAHLARAAMQISGMTVEQLAQRIAYVGRSFGLPSLAENTLDKLRQILDVRCVMGEVERSAVLSAALKPAADILQAELSPDPPDTPAERFAGAIRGALALSEFALDDAAEIVARLARRLWLGRMETSAAQLLKAFLGDSSAVDFTTQERRAIAGALFAVPLQALKAELENSK